MLRKFVIFGGTGDLANRFLFPALAHLHATDKLPDGFQVYAAARDDMGDDALRTSVATALGANAANVHPESRAAIVNALKYHQVDVARASDVRDVTERAAGEDRAPVGVYLALPPSTFADAVGTLSDVLTPGSRLAFEKPFGESLEDSIALNRLLQERNLAPEAIFRVDHVLGMPTVETLMQLRANHPVISRVWASERVEEIHVLWEETLALEDRAGFYDRTGALKDVMQNHLLQVLALVAMEPPAPGREDIHRRKLDALRAVRAPDIDAAKARTRRARYAAGRLAHGRSVPAYAHEDGVEGERSTETFAEVKLELDTARWNGTTFLLRAGKAMAERRKGVLMSLRPPEPGISAQLWIGIDGPNDVSLALVDNRGHETVTLGPFTLVAEPSAAAAPAYANVLFDFLSGSSALSVSGPEAEEAWRIVTPIMEGWAAGVVPLEDYPAGSHGPSSL